GRLIGLDNFPEPLSAARIGTPLPDSTLFLAGVVPPVVLLPLLPGPLGAGGGELPGVFRPASHGPGAMGAGGGGPVAAGRLERRGLINETLQWLQVLTEPIPFLTDRWLLLFAAMFVTVWMGLGYYMVIYLAALASIDPSLYDAAAMDGAGVVRTFMAVTMPGVRNTMML